MLIKWGSIVVDGSGKLGGHVFSKSRGGNTVRTLARATNPQTTFQQIIRSRFTQLSQGWRDLSESERESWYGAESSFSRKNRFGDVVLLSGKNLYNSLNAQRGVIGLSPLSLAPIPKVIPKNFVRKVEFNLSIPALFIRGDYGGSAEYIIVGTPRLSQGVQSGKNELRNVSRGISSPAGLVIRGGDVQFNNYVDRFGVPSIGDKIIIGSYSINVSGQRSPVSFVQAIIG